jgi:hypothetical protein
METNVRRELEALKRMVLNWKRSYLGWASPEGNNEYVIHEFSEEIQNHLYPYVRRMYEMEHLNDSESKEFMHYCYSEIEDLRRRVENLEAEETQ